MKTALIVEDLPETCAWLEAIAKEAFPGILVDMAGSIASARARLRQRQYALLLLDISLPDGTGHELLRHSAALLEGTYVVMATIYDDDDNLFGALKAGAQGYLLKDQPRQKLIDQLRGIALGEPALSPSVARRMLRYFQQPFPDMSECEALSSREIDVLRLLANGYKRSDIATALHISANTVAGHIKNIYRKLNVSGRAEAALQALRLGVIDRV